MDFEISGISAAPWIPLAWGFLVGLVFSIVGAAGGILASVGLISVLGVSNVNLVKPMAQMLTLISPIIAVPSYFKQGRLVSALALLLGAGGVAGALIGSTLSLNYLGELSTFCNLDGNSSAPGFRAVPVPGVPRLRSNMSSKKGARRALSESGSLDFR